MAAGARAARVAGAGLRPRRLALLLALAYGASGNVQAGPQGAQVVQGAASVVRSGALTTVTNTPGAIINWQSFSIGAGETTRFVQQNAASAVLNRVVGQDPSKILGTLSSNGKVFLVNPNGVVFGQGAMVDTAGLVVSTLNITDDDFRSGRMRFLGSALSGDLRIEGVLRSSSGDIYLIAPNIENAGAIAAQDGNAILAAGEKVEILGRGLDNIKFEVQNRSNRALNLGRIEGNAVGLFAGTIRQAGVINANSVGIENGRIVLRAQGDVSLAQGSVTRAEGAVPGATVAGSGGGAGSSAGGATAIPPGTANAASNGGSVSITALGGAVQIEGASLVSANAAAGAGNGGVVQVRALRGDLDVASGAVLSAAGVAGGRIVLQADAGTSSIAGSLLAPGTLPLSTPADTAAAMGATGAIGATGSTAAPGGVVQVLGSRVVLLNPALIDAAGDTAGGTILIGGDWQGANPAIQNATATSIASDVLLRADARLRGNGGKVVAWADEVTEVHGSIDVRGGGAGGDGGDVETSGRNKLIVTRAPLLAARRGGRGGNWLLDPTDIEIVAGPTSADIDLGDTLIGPSATAPGTTSQVDADLLAAVLSGGASVTVSTHSTAGAGGDLTVLAPINVSGSADATLRLQADRNIFVQADIAQVNVSAGRLNVSLGAALNASAGVVIYPGVGIDTRGGWLDIEGASVNSLGSLTTSGRRDMAGGDVRIASGSTGTIDIARLTADGGANAAGGNVVLRRAQPADFHLGDFSAQGGAGAAGGSLTLNLTAASTTAALVALDSINLDGGAGGAGGSFSLNSLGSGSQVTVSAVTARGGAGDADHPQGGQGGRFVLFVDGATDVVDVALNGGAGWSGADLGGTANGGGDGGSLTAQQLGANARFAFHEVLDLRGGAGGASLGSALPGEVRFAGGSGGRGGTIALLRSTDQVAFAGADLRGGDGGAVREDHLGTVKHFGTGGSGGAGGRIVDVGAQTVVLDNSVWRLEGGAGGTATVANGLTAFGGKGGAGGSVALFSGTALGPVQFLASGGAGGGAVLVAGGGAGGAGAGGDAGRIQLAAPDPDLTMTVLDLAGGRGGVVDPTGALATTGRAGSLALIAPNDFVIDVGGANAASPGAPVQIDVGLVNALLSGGGSVQLTSNDGRLEVRSDIAASGPLDASLALQARLGVNLQAGIAQVNANAGVLNLSLNADLFRGGGTLVLAPGVTIDTRGGWLEVGGMAGLADAGTIRTSGRAGGAAGDITLVGILTGGMFDLPGLEADGGSGGRGGNIRLDLSGHGGVRLGAVSARGGAHASGGSVSITAQGTGDLTLDGIVADGGAGAAGGALNLQSSGGGRVTVTSVLANGGAGAALRPGGGAGGTVAIVADGPIDLQTVSLRGGAGASGAEFSGAENGGGAGGTLSVRLDNAAANRDLRLLQPVDLAGGAGGASWGRSDPDQASFAGGAGGAGGSILALTNSSVGGLVQLHGGDLAGGAGGAVREDNPNTLNHTGRGGAGGAAGQVLGLAGASLELVSGSVWHLEGGAGGAATAANGLLAYGGQGGAGGSFALTLAQPAALGQILATGGTGGDVLAAGGSAGAAGPGGAGGTVELSLPDPDLLANSLDVRGGAGGRVDPAGALQVRDAGPAADGRAGHFALTTPNSVVVDLGALGPAAPGGAIQIDAGLIADILSGGGSVQLSTRSGTAAGGDVTVQAALNASGERDATLSLLARGDLDLLADIAQINASAGVLNLSLGAGVASQSRGITLGTNLNLATRGGWIKAFDIPNLAGASILRTAGRPYAPGGAVRVRVVNGNGALLLPGIVTDGGVAGAGGAIEIITEGLSGIQIGALSARGGAHAAGGDLVLGAQSSGDVSVASIDLGGGAGADAGALLVQSFGSGALTLGTISQQGGAGDAQLARGGRGGAAGISAGGAIALSGISLAGGAGWSGADPGGSGNDGGAAGTLTLDTATGASVRVLGAIDLTGGAGGDHLGLATPGAATVRGGAGGAGGALFLANDAAAGTLRLASLDTSGGQGGAARETQAGSIGHTAIGGIGGTAGTVELRADNVIRDPGATWRQQGGAGGAGSAGNGALAQGGQGGAGAELTVLAAQTLSLQTGDVLVQGGAGGAVDAAGGTVAGAGAGGRGGSITLSGDQLTIAGGDWNAGGGAGGAVTGSGALGAAAGLPGAGGGGGVISVTGGTLSLSALRASTQGGAGGASGTGLAASAGADGGQGGAIRMESTGTLSLLASFLVADGGAGSDGARDSNAATVLLAGGAGGRAGAVALSALGDLQLLDGAIRSAGGQGGAGGAVTGSGALGTGADLAQFAGGAGGDAGSIALTAGGALRSTDFLLDSIGGAGGAGGAAAGNFQSVDAQGGRGGQGGAIALEAAGLVDIRGKTGTSHIAALGGAGGAAGAVGPIAGVVAAAGGSGGASGTLTVRGDGLATAVRLNQVDLESRGGAGGAGGAVDGATLGLATVTSEGGLGGAAAGLRLEASDRLDASMVRVSVLGGAAGAAGALGKTLGAGLTVLTTPATGGVAGAMDLSGLAGLSLDGDLTLQGGAGGAGRTGLVAAAGGRGGSAAALTLAAASGALDLAGGTLRVGSGLPGANAAPTAVPPAQLVIRAGGAVAQVAGATMTALGPDGATLQLDVTAGGDLSLAGSANQIDQISYAAPGRVTVNSATGLLVTGTGQAQELTLSSGGDLTIAAELEALGAARLDAAGAVLFGTSTQPGLLRAGTVAVEARGGGIGVGNSADAKPVLDATDWVPGSISLTATGALGSDALPIRVAYVEGSTVQVDTSGTRAAGEVYLRRLGADFNLADVRFAGSMATFSTPHFIQLSTAGTNLVTAASATGLDYGTGKTAYTLELKPQGGGQVLFAGNTDYTFQGAALRLTGGASGGAVLFDRPNRAFTVEAEFHSDMNMTVAADTTLNLRGPATARHAIDANTLNLSGTFNIDGSTASSLAFDAFKFASGRIDGSGSLTVRHDLDRDTTPGATAFGTRWQALSFTHDNGPLRFDDGLNAAVGIRLHALDGDVEALGTGGAPALVAPFLDLVGHSVRVDSKVGALSVQADDATLNNTVLPFSFDAVFRYAPGGLPGTIDITGVDIAGIDRTDVVFAGMNLTNLLPADLKLPGVNVTKLIDPARAGSIAGTIGNDSALLMRKLEVANEFNLRNLGGPVSQEGLAGLAVRAANGGVLRIDNPGQVINLATSANSFGLLSLTAASAIINHTGPALTLDGISLTGDLAIDKPDGSISQSGPIVVGGHARFNAPAGNVVLNDSANSFGQGLSLTADSALVAHTGNLLLESVNTALLLVQNRNGAVTQASGAAGALRTSDSLVVINPGGAIVLDNPLNEVDVSLNLTGASASVQLISAAPLGGVSLTGDLNLTARGGINQSGRGFSLSGPLAPEGLSVGGVTRVASMGDVLLDHPQNAFTGGLAVTAGSFSLLNHTGTLTLAGVTTTGALNLTTVGGAMVANGPIVAGTASFASDGELRLANTGNSFSSVALRAPGDVTLNTASGLDLGEVVVGGNFQVDASGLNQGPGSIRVTGATTLTAVGSVSLRTAGNRFDGGLSVSADDAIIELAGSLVTDRVNLRKPSTFSVGGDLTQTAAWDVAGPLNVTSGGRLVLDTPTNRFGGLLTLNAGGNLSLDATGTLQLGAVDAGGAIGIAAPVIQLAGVGAHLTAGTDLALTGGAVALGAPVSGVTVRLVGTDTLGVQADVTANQLTLEGGAGGLVVGGSATQPLTVSSATVLDMRASGTITLGGGTASTSLVSVGNATVNAGGTLRILGGLTAGAFTLLDPSAPGASLDIVANGIVLQGGPTPNAYAAIASTSGPINLTVGAGGLSLFGGAGLNTDAVVYAPNGFVTLTGTCITACPALTVNPFLNFVTEIGLSLPPVPVVVPPPAPPAAPPLPPRTVIDDVINEVIRGLPPKSAPPAGPAAPATPMIENDDDC